MVQDRKDGDERMRGKDDTENWRCWWAQFFVDCSLFFSCLIKKFPFIGEIPSSRNLQFFLSEALKSFFWKSWILFGWGLLFKRVVLIMKMLFNYFFWGPFFNYEDLCMLILVLSGFSFCRESCCCYHESFYWCWPSWIIIYLLYWCRKSPLLVSWNF